MAIEHRGEIYLRAVMGISCKERRRTSARPRYDVLLGAVTPHAGRPRSLKRILTVG